MADVEEITEIKITKKKLPGFYVRHCRNFLEGMPAKEAIEGTNPKAAKEAKLAQSQIVVCALGNAISICGSVVARLESEGVAEIVKCETLYPKIASGSNESQVAQLRVTMKVSGGLPAVSEEGYHEGKMKKVKKEGGKKGSELAGAADMGGIEYFTTTCETPEGDPKLLEIVNQEMNVEVNPEEEETKGGSGRVAKCLLSASAKHLAILTYVPKEKVATVSAEVWMKHIIECFGGYGKILEGDYPSNQKCVAVLEADEKGGKFPIKLRDEGVSFSIGFLKSKGLFPDQDDDSDEMIFGDDDFPS